MTDTELDILKKRRLLQMQKRLQTKKTESQVIGKDKETSVSLNQVFVGKAWGVLEAARHQYPKELKRIEEVLLTLISEGQNKGENQRRRTLQFLSSIGLKGETWNSHSVHGAWKTEVFRGKNEGERVILAHNTSYLITASHPFVR